jgi:hypothetical protein
VHTSIRVRVQWVPVGAGIGSGRAAAERCTCEQHGTAAHASWYHVIRAQTSHRLGGWRGDCRAQRHRLCDGSKGGRRRVRRQRRLRLHTALTLLHTTPHTVYMQCVLCVSLRHVAVVVFIHTTYNMRVQSCTQVDCMHQRFLALAVLDCCSQRSWWYQQVQRVRLTASKR